ncbi:helix-turn-helix domain-containing protein [Mucilaginibacter sp. L196]|uniref:winged helix-turn-helix transcriptional regulator n=1 Tax=Mucilaginibacter sp. L196 TaxID=1641870 RepID=UPI00131DE1C0|nr:helix-turn-helix domain-containing protein [Mucilaginibacter sp. L196]
MPDTRKNKDYNPYNCPVTHCMNKIGGKWKILIIYAVSKNVNRFGKLQKVLPLMSKQMLVNQLRELEVDNILDRHIFAEMPPRVEYQLTERGKSLMPVIKIMQEWGVKDLEMESTLTI